MVEVSGPVCRFREIADESPVIMWSFGCEGRGTFFNKAWLEFTGRTQDQELGLGWTDDVHPEDMIRCADALILRFSTGEQFTLEHRLKRADGTYRWMFTTCSPRRNGEELLDYVAWSVDITESREAQEQNVSKNQRRFDLLATATNDASWEWDAASPSVWCNDQFFSVFRLPPRNITHEFWKEAVHPDDQESFHRSIQLAFEHRDALWVGEYRLRRGDGTYATVRDRAVIVYASDGTPIHMTGGMRDVSAEREALAAIKGSEARNRALIEHASDAIFVVDEQCNFLEVNAQTCKLLGYTADELLKLNVRDIIDQEDLDCIPLAIDAVLDGKVIILERNYQRKDGAIILVENSVKLVSPGIIQVIARDISERRRAEEALRDSELRYRTLVETSTEGIWMGDVNHKTVFVNSKLAEMVAASVEECLTRPWEEFIYPDDLPAVQNLIAQRTNGVSEPYDARLLGRNGEPLWVQISTCVLCDYSGQRIGQLSTITNVHARKSAEERLRATAERLETVLNNAPLGIVTSDLSGRMVETNAAFQAMLGYSADELRGAGILDFTHPDDRKRCGRLMANVSNGKRDRYETEKRYIRKDGFVIWVHVVVATLRSKALGDLAMIALVEDITEKKRAHDDLQLSEERFRALLDSDLIGVIVGDSEGNLSYANDAFLRITGYSRADMEAGLNWRGITAPGYELIMAKTAREFQETGMIGPLEKQYVRKDGSRVSVLLGGARYKNNNAISIVLDLTELKKAQREVNRLATIVESTDDAVLSVALDGTILTWNKGAENLYRFTAEEIIGRSETILVPGGRDDEEVEKAKLRAISGGALDHVEAVHLTKMREARPVSITVSPLRDANGEIVGWSKIVRDLTFIKRAEQLEEQFRQAQKLEAVGRLAGGVAHDFNNLLMIISSYTEMIYSKLAPEDKLRSKAREVLKAAEKAADLTRQLLAFSRKQVLLSQAMDVNSVVTEMVGMARRLMGRDIHLSFNPGENLWPIKADPGQISQVLLNLFINARDAMPDGGTLTIETRNIVVDAKPPKQIASFNPGKYVEITVTDTGIGMSEETKMRIFEPFFTTKGSKGTGLGLSTVYGIVKQSGGYVWADSTPGVGTRFDLYFPRTENDPVHAVQAEKSAVQHQGETILLVDDEEALRTSVSEYLNELGYRVLEAESGKKALEIAQSYNGPIDLLLTDVVMPEMSGMEIAKKLAKGRTIRTLYMSGYSDEVVASQDVLRSGADFISKPFSLNVLARKLSELLTDSQKRERVM